MKRMIISDAIGKINDQYIEEAANCHPKKNNIVWTRWVSVASCICLIMALTVFAVYQIQKRTEPDIPTVTDNDTQKNDPTEETADLRCPSDLPMYYGDGYSADVPSNSTACAFIPEFAVIAEFAEMLPDTYTIFDDWQQYELCLLKFRTIKLIKGENIPDEFYFIIPADYMTDYSVYDTFVLSYVAQFGYEHHVVYNKTQGNAERLELPIFGHGPYALWRSWMTADWFKVYDSNGRFDERLWESCEGWIKSYQEYDFKLSIPLTLEAAEQQIKNKNDIVKVNAKSYSLDGVTGEAKTVLDEVLTFENGIYVPVIEGINDRTINSFGQQFHARRYINGFATNEKVSIFDLNDEDEVCTYQFSKARFDENDLNALPDLESAIKSVASDYDKGELTPPHIKNYDETTVYSYGILGWYAKTDSGVLGVIRVSWRCDLFLNNDRIHKMYDDAYYIIEYGEDEYKQIDRDNLLERLGEYENLYIYQGGYDEEGKTRFDPLRYN